MFTACRLLLGSVKLWDAAGALPILLRLGLEASLDVDGQLVPVTTAVDERTYDLSPDSPQRWSFRSTLLVCHRGDGDRRRRSWVEEPQMQD